MAKLRKLTLEVPAELLEKAQEASGAGIAQTVRACDNSVGKYGFPGISQS